MKNEIISKAVDNYYTGKFKKWGATPKGVDWNNKQDQYLRFKKLMGFIDKKNLFSINDLGCGFGSLVEYLHLNEYNFSYKGYDFSIEMIKKAKKHIEGDNKVDFHVVDENLHLNKMDYTVASGIFNVKMDFGKDYWNRYVFDTLKKINQYSEKGFSFNMLTSYSDKKFMRDDLFYADPCNIFDYCKKNFAKNVSLLHDYDLYEFTIYVLKN